MQLATNGIRPVIPFPIASVAPEAQIDPPASAMRVTAIRGERQRG